MTNSSVSPQEAAQELLRRKAARKSLLSFTEYTTPRWSPGPIHAAICEQLDRVAAGEIDRLLLLCPPQHGKSTITSKRFGAYLLGLDPTREIIGASATQLLADEFGGAVRDCIRSQEFQNLFPGVQLREDSQARGRWSTPEGGGYYAIGIGGALFGRGGMLIIDDPFASWEDAQSEIQRKRVWSWFTGTAYNRVRPGQPIVVIQHRMHEDDLVGKLLDEERGNPLADRWTVVKLAADLDSPPWPQRYDRAALERIKANTSPLEWSALYLQDPTPEDGTYFKSAWFGEYEQLPDRLNIYAASDFAVTADGGDYTEHGIFGVDANANIYVIDWWRGQTSADVWIERFCDLVLKHEPLRWFCESGVIRKSVEPFLIKRMSERSANCWVEWIPSIQDKPTRARSIQARAAMGKVWFPKHAVWKGDVLTQLLKFDQGKFDDAVDVFGLIGRGLDMVVNAAPNKPEREMVMTGWMG